MINLSGKVALVTGASRSIGKAITIELAKCGATVIGTDIDQATADMINAYLRADNLPGQGLVMNVTDQNSIDEALINIRNNFAPPDILVNNAGITRDNLMLRMKIDDWQAVIDTNLTAVFRVSQACLKDMVKNRFGRIITITSVVGYTGNPGQTNYSATKAGVIALNKSLAKEVASRGITANCVAPGFIDTPMTQKLTDEQKQALLSIVPAQQVGQPEDVAYAVSFLASNRANYITGTTIHVNGGLFML